jgi:HAD superfamily phosphatase (TIGR01668 family)
VSRFFTPDYYFETLDKVPENFFKDNKITLIICDIDNTLATYDDVYPTEYTRQFIDRMKAEGIVVELISNNSCERVETFSRELDCHYVGNGKKPFCSTKPIKEAMKKTSSVKEGTLIIGDQIFTDVLAGRMASIKTMLVEPLGHSNLPFFGIKRALEKPIKKRYVKKYGKNV